MLQGELCNSFDALNNAFCSIVSVLGASLGITIDGLKPTRIIKNNDAMIVFWKDGTKTVVKRAEDEIDSDYAAFTAALGIKTYGSNSALKRIVARTETQKPKKQKAGD